MEAAYGKEARTILPALASAIYWNADLISVNANNSKALKPEVETFSVVVPLLLPMATFIQLPYFATSIPAPLPSVETIRAAPLISDGSRRVAKVGNHFIVKYGARVNTMEGENMLFVQQHTRIQVPQVYAIYGTEDGCNYIIMEYVPGQTLASVWSSLSRTQKETIAGILKSYLSDLRALPPPDYFGSIGKRPLLEDIFWTPDGIQSISGPFATETELNEGMTRNYVRYGGSSYKTELYRRAFPGILKDHATMFTHGDFQRKNIMVYMPSGDTIHVTIIDWEKSAWLPSYWEFSMAMLSQFVDDDWHEWLVTITDPFYNEFAFVQMMHLDLWS